MVSCKTKADIKLDIVEPILDGCCHDILSHFLITSNLKEISKPTIF